MKVKKFIRRMVDRFDLEQRKSASRKARIKQVLKDLKAQQHKLAERLDSSSDDKQRKKFKAEIAVLKAQREKGLKILKSLRKD